MSNSKLILMVILMMTLISCEKHIEKPVALNVSESTNYVYHMLSVSGVGYSNAYGETYESFHDADDLEYLKSVASLISVEGGKYNGELYGTMVVLPATLSSLDEIALYYNSYIHILNGEGLSLEEQGFMEEYIERSYSKLDVEMSLEEMVQNIMDMPYHEEILRISDIFLRNVNIYHEQIYPIEKEKMDRYIEKFHSVYSLDGVINDLEEIIGFEYLEEDFRIELTTSTNGGPIAIDISNTQDMLYIINPGILKEFATHEIAIYILKQNGLFALEEEFPEKSFYELWIYFESLAEYYNEMLYGRKTLSYSNGSREIIAFYEEHSEFGAKRLLLEAIRHFEDSR